MTMIDAAAQTGGAQLDPVYRAVYHVLNKDAEEHGRGKVLSSAVSMLENNDDPNQLHRGETVLRYVSSTIDDIPYVLGKVLYRDMKTISWTAVDSGKPIHVPKVSTHAGVTLWNTNRREEVRILGSLVPSLPLSSECEVQVTKDLRTGLHTRLCHSVTS